jgi:regulator of cell morphogenesis and NO signaling
MQFTENAKMSDIIHDDYRLLQVISRFGISLGFGNQSVQTACEAAGVHTPTFLAVVNSIIGAGHGNVEALVPQVSVAELMRYLQRSHSYFVDFRLPAIRRKLIEAIDCSAKNQIAFLILKFYDEYAAEVERHMDYENQHIHTYVQGLLDGKVPGADDSYGKLAHQHHDNHSSLYKSSDELKSIIVKYYPSDSDTQRLADTLMDIYIMEEDLFSHCQLEDTLFALAVERMEQDVRDSNADASPASSADDEAAAALPDGLSEREKEVVRLVVSGLSNKEIAERMFISTNTVMTHRRNIARKTQVRSSAALTIYAIVNGLVNLDEVKV